MKVLIISPHFPPQNAADMQRVRTSLPYFKEFGWDAEVVTVDESYSPLPTDHLLLQTVPDYIKVHKIKALNRKWTSKLGLGSLALRSLWFFYAQVNRLLKQTRFDLVYFSTTQFPVCVLGAYWKKRFGIPYVIDMQDPWHSEYYQDKPKEQRPPKYWFSYRLNKMLEPIALKHADGLIAVSANYIYNLKTWYPEIKAIPADTITFGAFAPDLAIALKHEHSFEPLLSKNHINIVYVGRGGYDMHKAIRSVLEVFKQLLLQNEDLYGKLKFYFIGTSYAPAGQGKTTILPLAQELGVQQSVVEVTNRISYFHTLATLQQAHALFIAGSDDPDYTASKIYPYLLSKKPLLAVFNEKSSAVGIIKQSAPKASVYTIPANDAATQAGIGALLSAWAQGSFDPVETTPEFEKYSAKQLTLKQGELFAEVLKSKQQVKPI